MRNRADCGRQETIVGFPAILHVEKGPGLATASRLDSPETSDFAWAAL